MKPLTEQQIAELIVEAHQSVMSVVLARKPQVEVDMAAYKALRLIFDAGVRNGRAIEVLHGAR